MFGRQSLWPKHDGDLEQDRMIDEIKSALVFFLLIIVTLLVLLYNPKKQASPPGVSNWPPGIPLRIEARRDFNLKGGPLRDGICITRSSGFGSGSRSVTDDPRERSHECSDADHDLYARYIDPDGNEFDVLSHSWTENAEGAFRHTVPKVKGRSYGKTPGDRSYDDAIGSGMYRVEEITYAHRFIKPGTYHVNVHLERADRHIRFDDVLISIFVVLYEGTPDEIVVFNDRIALNIKDVESREKTVVTFEIDEKGQLIEDSVNLETQVNIAEQ